MKTLTILHITDIHFGDRTSDSRAHFKDEQVKENIGSVFKNNSWIDSFKRKLVEWQKRETVSIDLIAFTGDLCYCGNATKMEEGIFFLCQVCEILELPLDKLIIAPGNHDLDRKKAGHEFDDFIGLCNKYGIINFAVYDKIASTEVKEVSVIALNSCLGATATVKNINVDRFKRHILELEKDDNFNMHIQNLRDDESLYYQTDLDIPVIGDVQLTTLLEKVSQVKETCFLLMHHNPIPNTNIEIRPYSNLLDSGVLMHDLLDTGKKFFILHGHTHLQTCISSFLPDDESTNFISTISCGCLNGNNGGRAQIIASLFTDNNECLKTTIHQLTNAGATFKFSKFEINNRDIIPNIRIKWSNLNHNQKYTFQEIKKCIFNDETKELTDDDILGELLNRKGAFKILKNGSQEYLDWHFKVTQ